LFTRRGHWFDPSIAHHGWHRANRLVRRIAGKGWSFQGQPFVIAGEGSV
jgi:hypothetical protein